MGRLSLGMVVCLAGALLAEGAVGAERAETRWRVYKTWPFDAAEAKRRQEETARALGVKVEQDFALVRGAPIRMVLIPAGQFLMGSAVSGEEVMRLEGYKPGRTKPYPEEHPQHRVTITKPFWMGKYEVTQAQWLAVTGKRPSRTPGEKHPVEMVNCRHVQGFLEKANAGGGAGGFRLPTEAQWEYACRAGTATAFHCGPTLSTDQANYLAMFTYAGSARGKVRKHPVPVGSFPANAWGLHDVHGNVSEWCADWYDVSYYGASPPADPTGPAKGYVRVQRGGSWFAAPVECRSAHRGREGPLHGSGAWGFRVCRPHP